MLHRACLVIGGVAIIIAGCDQGPTLQPGSPQTPQTVEHETEQKEPQSLEHKLAMIDKQGYVDPDATVVTRYRYLIGVIAERCDTDRERIAYLAIGAQKILRDKYGVEETILRLLGTGENLSDTSGPYPCIEARAVQQYDGDKAELLFAFILKVYN